MKNLILIVFSTLHICQLSAQEAGKFYVKLSTDSILMDNHFELRFTLENVDGRNFVPPDFEGFEVVGGPNQSMVTSFVNGEMSKSLSYSYFLKPEDIGSYFIGPASIMTESGSMETIAVEINVFPNPDGIRQRQKNEEHNSFDFFKEELPGPEEPKQKYSKKRPIYKI